MDKEKVKLAADQVFRDMAGAISIFHCMTQSLARGGPGLGTCLGPAGPERLVREAGFSQFKQLDLKSQTNLFYSAKP